MADVKAKDDSSNQTAAITMGILRIMLPMGMAFT